MSGERWSSRFAFVLAGIGSAVGLGNIWRFPYMMGENGGANFLLAYVAALFLIGIPMLVAEFMVGRKFRGSCVKVFESMNRKIPLLKYVPPMVQFIILSYYTVVTGWTLFYLVSSLSGQSVPFSQFASSFLPLVFTIFVILLCFFVLRAKLKDGLETVNKIMIPALFIIMVALAANSAFHFGVSDALSYASRLDTQRIFDPSIWIAAVSQVVFSLSIGLGIMVTYGGYVDKKTSISRSAFLVAIPDALIALIAAFLVFSTAFGFGMDVGAGPTLAFDSLPKAFGMMPYGLVLMALFFAALFCAAFTSLISICEVFIPIIQEKVKLDHGRSVLWLSFAMALVSLPVALSYTSFSPELFGKPLLDALDGAVVKYGTPFSILVTALYIGWLYKGFPKLAEAEFRKEWRRRFVVLVRYAVPVALGLLFLTSAIFPSVRLVCE